MGKKHDSQYANFGWLQLLAAYLLYVYPLSTNLEVDSIL